MKWQERDKILAIVNKINKHRTQIGNATLRVEKMHKEKGRLKKVVVLTCNITDEEKVYQMVKESMSEHKIDFNAACRKISYEVSQKILQGVAI